MQPPGYGHVPLQSPCATRSVSGRSPALFPTAIRKSEDFFFSFLCLTATASMTFLVSLYPDLSTQHVVLFLVSRFVACHLSVLALAPASPGFVPESLLTWQGSLLMRRCAGVYRPGSLEILPGAGGQAESQRGLLPRKTRGNPRSSAGVWPHLWRRQWGRVRSPGGDVSIPQPSPGVGQAFIPCGIYWAVVFVQMCPRSQMRSPRGFAGLCRSRDFAGAQLSLQPCSRLPVGICSFTSVCRLLGEISWFMALFSACCAPVPRQR